MQTQCKPEKGINVREKEKPAYFFEPDLMAATLIIGSKVKGKNGKVVGKVEEIILDLTSDSISYLVVSSGGMLGIGDKFFAVPLSALTIDPEERTFYLDVSKRELKRHAGFDKHNWPKKPQWPPN
jgi:sporulation protein YlmC with PRC-barrel domain